MTTYTISELLSNGDRRLSTCLTPRYSLLCQLLWNSLSQHWGLLPSRSHLLKWNITDFIFLGIFDAFISLLLPLLLNFFLWFFTSLFGVSLWFQEVFLEIRLWALAAALWSLRSHLTQAQTFFGIIIWTVNIDDLFFVLSLWCALSARLSRQLLLPPACNTEVFESRGLIVKQFSELWGSLESFNFAIGMNPLITIFALDPLFSINISVISCVDIDLVAVVAKLVVLEGLRAPWA